MRNSGCPFYYGLVAEVCSLAGQTGEALANVASGFAYQNKNREIWSHPNCTAFMETSCCETAIAVPARKRAIARAIDSARQIGAR